MRKMSITAAAVMRLAIQQGIGRFDELRYDHRLYRLLLRLTGLREEASLGLPATPNTKPWAALGRDLRREPKKFGHAGNL